ncbi:MAG: hypothetical protein ACKO37_08280, partial [Vampirovibrionales bacterium]
YTVIACGLAWMSFGFEATVQACGYGASQEATALVATDTTTLPVLRPVPLTLPVLQKTPLVHDLTAEPIYLMPALEEAQDDSSLGEEPPVLREDEEASKSSDPSVETGVSEPSIDPPMLEDSQAPEPSSEQQYPPVSDVTPDASPSSEQASAPSLESQKRETSQKPTSTSIQEESSAIKPVQSTCQASDATSSQSTQHLKQLVQTQQNEWKSYLPLVEKPSRALQTLLWLWQYHDTKPTPPVALVNTLQTHAKTMTLAELLTFQSVLPQSSWQALIASKTVQPQSHGWLRSKTVASHAMQKLLEGFIQTGHLTDDNALQVLLAEKRLTLTEIFAMTSLATQSCDATLYQAWADRYVEAYKKALRRSKFKY